MLRPAPIVVKQKTDETGCSVSSQIQLPFGKTIGLSMQLTGNGQANYTVAFKPEGHEFESSNQWSTSTVGSPLLAKTLFLKNVVHC